MSETPDEILLPLKERLHDWTEYDVACFFLGKTLGVIGPDKSYSESKHMFFGTYDPIGVQLIDCLIFLAGQGILESRDSNFEFRWRSE
jgi:hypothetical protein